MKGFNHYMFWFSGLALFAVCGLYFSFYPSPAWTLASVPGALLLGGALYAWLARRERFDTLFGLDTEQARWWLHLTLGSLLTLVLWGALQVPVAALYTQWMGQDAEFAARVLDKDDGGLGCQFRVELVLDDASIGVGVCVSEAVWYELPDRGAVVMRGKRSALGINPREVLRVQTLP
ncbi:hypothetical protein [Metapseudomonas resinovorans]|uniref:Uncharacterized protein n=1 Tax=Metapseudomonas resinovorans NBRC 106553 TaxID=1245471 RepID=S6AFM5_METRE|nr:hypothetical protein [Pseudomonas resinovorans]BAN46640.1 hypothetical protein PCA10_09080 [Pseudomonas resinovorans NBRC 106553]